MSNSDTRFTALGMSGSGKTCYILGMYYEMVVGCKGFTLITENAAASKLERWMETLDNTCLNHDRFPAGTPMSEIVDYSFMLCHNNKDILGFDWSDYGGGTLQQKDGNPEIFAKLNKSIEESTALYIFIDGDYFCEDTYDKRLNNVKRKCSRYINPLINNFFKSHNDKMVPIVFVVTKIDKIRRYTDNDDVNAIIKEAFSPEFSKGYTAYVTSVSLGKNLSDNDYSGEVGPINIHVPFFIGIFYDFMKRTIITKQNLIKNISTENSKKGRLDSDINDELSRRFLWFNRTDYSRVTELTNKKNDKDKTIKECQNTVDTIQKLFNVIKDELIRQESNYNVYIDGQLQDRLPDYDV